MASIEFTDPKCFARDVAAFSDAQLDQYLEDHRLDGGAMVVEVQDPENLPQSFIQRLRDRAQHTSDTNQSRPVDPSQLTSRLLDISSNRNTSPRLPPPSFDRESSDDTLPPTPTEQREKISYNILVEEGGRPLYSSDLIDEVAKDPFSHWDMLRPWVDHPPDFEPDPDPDADLYVNWTVFGRQLGSWREFYDWQKFNRGDFTRWGDSYEVRAAYHYFVPAFRRECPTYTDAVKKLLAEYGFTRPLQFHENPTKQDKLTTWIEYLGYECWVHYRYASRVKRMQPKYDVAWKKLMESSVLRPFETEEYVCNIECALRHQSEEDQATRAVTSARSAAKAVLTSVYNDIDNPRGSRLTSAARLQMMEEAKLRVEGAEEALASTKRRNDLVTEFMQSVGHYLTSKREAERHNIRVRWTLEQVPLIEAELNESSMAKSSPESIRGVKRSLECDENDDASHDRILKKQRRDAGEPGPTPSSKDGPGHQRAKPKRSRDDAADEGSPSKRLKRSGQDLESTPGRNDSPGYQRAKPKRRRDVAADEGPPAKRLKRGGVDLGSHSETPDGADAGSAGDSHESGTTELGGSYGDDLAARTTESPNSKGNPLSSDHLQQRKRTRNARQPSKTTQPLRRSARIAAHQGALQLQTAVTRSSAAKSLPRCSQRSTVRATAPPLRTGSLDEQSRLLARKAKKQGARGRSRLNKSDTGPLG